MKMTCLRDPRPVLALVRKLVPLDDGDPVEMVGEHARREHAPDAAAHHDGVAARTFTRVAMLPRAMVLHWRIPLSGSAVLRLLAQGTVHTKCQLFGHLFPKGALVKVAISSRRR
jgi:hypothetical protein